MFDLSEVSAKTAGVGGNKNSGQILAHFPSFPSRYRY